MRRATINPRDRLGSAALVVAIHLLLGWALISSLGVRVVPRIDETLKLFNLKDQPPPPPPIVPPPPPRQAVEQKPKDPEGAAAPLARRNTPTEIVAPEAPRPTPLPAARVPGQGSAAQVGAAPIDGPGTGAGGIGDALGSGLRGDGNGGGGNGGRASPAQQVAGDIGNDDYPPAALNVRAQGTTLFSFTVRTDGRIEDCRVTRSSGNRALDATTCDLALRRLRYRPAVDRDGRPRATRVDGEQEWRLGAERELPPDDDER